MEKHQVISFEREEGKAYITVGELKKHLNNFDDDLIIIMSKDGEGNNYSPLSDGITRMYVPNSSYSGIVYHDKEDAKYCGETKFKINALVLYPIN